MTKQQLYLELIARAPAVTPLSATDVMRAAADLLGSPDHALLPVVRSSATGDKVHGATGEEVRKLWEAAGSPMHPRVPACERDNPPRAAAYSAYMWAKEQAENLVNDIQGRWTSDWPFTFAEQNLERVWARLQELRE